MKTVWVSETRHWWNNWIGVSLWSPWVRWVHLICFYSADHFTFCCGWEKLLIPALLPQCEAGQSEKTAGHQSTAEHTHTHVHVPVIFVWHFMPIQHNTRVVPLYWVTVEKCLPQQQRRNRLSLGSGYFAYCIKCTNAVSMTKKHILAVGRGGAL